MSDEAEHAEAIVIVNLMLNAKLRATHMPEGLRVILESPPKLAKANTVIAVGSHSNAIYSSDVVAERLDTLAVYTALNEACRVLALELQEKGDLNIQRPPKPGVPHLS